ncbi:MAG: PD-(D/E)XK nuclease family protein, partial [Afipia sp.]
LIIPHLPEASAQSWSRIVDLSHNSLPEIDLTALSPPTSPKEVRPTNEQTRDAFEEEARAVASASPPLSWRTPSTHDRDRAEALTIVESSLDDTFQFFPPIAGGRIRGIVLHKLMEEFLTGELGDDDFDRVEVRAADLLLELKNMEGPTSSADPDPGEMARTAMRTLKLDDVAALRQHLVPEMSVWSDSGDGQLIAGRADAVAIRGEESFAILDWKSDVAPGRQDRSDHIAQLSDYVTAIGVSRGAIVYMSLGEVVWVSSTAK